MSRRSRTLRARSSPSAGTGASVLTRGVGNDDPGVRAWKGGRRIDTDREGSQERDGAPVSDAARASRLPRILVEERTAPVEESASRASSIRRSASSRRAASRPAPRAVSHRRRARRRIEEPTITVPSRVPSTSTSWRAGSVGPASRPGGSVGPVHATAATSSIGTMIERARIAPPPLSRALSLRYLERFSCAVASLLERLSDRSVMCGSRRI